jgi:hypothetical protein
MNNSVPLSAASTVRGKELITGGGPEESGLDGNDMLPTLERRNREGATSGDAHAASAFHLRKIEVSFQTNRNGKSVDR